MTAFPRTLSFAATLTLVVTSTAAAQATSTFAVPAWAFPNIAPELVAKPPFDSVAPIHVPRSAKTYTLAQVKNTFGPPDWHASSHPPAPDVVTLGKRPAQWACGYCHLPDGQGRSENATLAGLSVEYFTQQMQDIRSGERQSALKGWGPSQNMTNTVRNITDEEIATAARYFAGLRATPRYKVVERARVPRTLEAGGLYAPNPAGGTEPLGARIIDVTTDLRRHEMRDAAETFVVYVPVGSIARGRKLATSTTTPQTSCIACHGPTLRGLAAAPPLAGRSPAYLLRQLIGFRTGARAGATSDLMVGVVANLELDDMIAVSAYAGSLKP
ncbi:MAG: c-type cytochrome [Gemmatimonadaceae bacterium]